MAEPVNEVLLSNYITHQHYLERYKTFQIKQLVVILKEAEVEMKAVISSMAGKMPSEVSVARKNALLKQIQGIQKEYNNKLNSVLRSDMYDLSVQEMQFSASQIENALSAVGIEFSTNLLTPEKLHATIDKTPILFSDGRYYTVQSLIKTFTDKNVGTATQTVRNGFLLNQSIDKIAKQLFGLQGSYVRTYNNAASVARTLVMHYAQTAKDLYFKNNRDVVKGYEWVSTLDSGTTAVCMHRDGLVWIYDVTELSTLPGEVRPPAHYACRSVTTPVLRSWKELGIAGIKEFSPGTRASMTGQVPEKLTYTKWFNDLDKYSTRADTIRKDILGPVRYDLWRRNELKLESFYGNDGRWLSLKELSKKDLEISKEYVRYF